MKIAILLVAVLSLSGCGGESTDEKVKLIEYENCLAQARDLLKTRPQLNYNYPLESCANMKP